jgi:hypothetical protein
MRSKLLAEALRKTPNLEIVSFPPIFCLPDDMVTISQNPSLKAIHIKSSFDRTSIQFRNELKLEANAKLQALIRFVDVTWVLSPYTQSSHFHLLLDSIEEPKREEPPVTLRPFISPLERASKDVQEQIWDEILAYALHVDLESVRRPDMLTDRILRRRVGLLVTCKLFNVRYHSCFPCR